MRGIPDSDIKRLLRVTTANIIFYIRLLIHIFFLCNIPSTSPYLLFCGQYFINIIYYGLYTP